MKENSRKVFVALVAGGVVLLIILVIVLAVLKGRRSPADFWPPREKQAIVEKLNERVVGDEPTREGRENLAERLQEQSTSAQ